MLGFDVRTARATWTVALVVLAIYATYSIRRTLFVFVLAVFFSYLLYPLVRRLKPSMRRSGSRTPHRPRSSSGCCCSRSAGCSR